MIEAAATPTQLVCKRQGSKSTDSGQCTIGLGSFHAMKLLMKQNSVHNRSILSFASRIEMWLPMLLSVYSSLFCGDRTKAGSQEHEGAELGEL